MSSSGSTIWSYEEEKAFENAIATHWIEEDSEEKWEKIASAVPSKSMDELKLHYRVLVEDVSAIEGGNIQAPNYVGEEIISSNKDSHGSSRAPTSDKTSNCDSGSGFSGLGPETIGNSGKGGLSKSSDQERRKGIPWTEEEHRLFLLGLEKYGKGDWRSISRNFVISRTPTQVASHAQKYFIRLNSMNRERRRSSIHDITNLNNNGNSANNQAPITGQHSNTNPSNTMAVGQSVNHKPQPYQTAAGIGSMYEAVAPVGHPVSVPNLGHMASAVGTPVMLPPGSHLHPHHPPYVVPLADPMAPPTMHR